MSLVAVVGMYLIRWTTIGNKIVRRKSLSLAYFTSRGKNVSTACTVVEGESWEGEWLPSHEIQ